MTQRAGFVPSSTTVAAIAVLALTVGWTPLAEADITRIVITRVESPTFEGVSFGEGRASTRNYGCVRLAKSTRPIRGTT